MKDEGWIKMPRLPLSSFILPPSSFRRGRFRCRGLRFGWSHLRFAGTGVRRLQRADQREELVGVGGHRFFGTVALDDKLLAPGAEDRRLHPIARKVLRRPHSHVLLVVSARKIDQGDRDPGNLDLFLGFLVGFSAELVAPSGDVGLDTPSDRGHGQTSLGGVALCLGQAEFRKDETGSRRLSNPALGRRQLHGTETDLRPEVPRRALAVGRRGEDIGGRRHVGRRSIRLRRPPSNGRFARVAATCYEQRRKRAGDKPTNHQHPFLFF